MSFSSSHDIFKARAFAHTHFPGQKYVMVPPEDKWEFAQPGMEIRNGAANLVGKGIFDILKYDDLGYLAIQTYARPEHSFASGENYTYLVKDTFSRIDIALVATALYGEYFYCKDAGLKRNKTEPREILKEISVHFDFHTDIQKSYSHITHIHTFENIKPFLLTMLDKRLNSPN